MTYLAYIIAAFCLANGLPHFFKGVCGERFQSPFAFPPGVGESSPLINVLWALVNFALATLLVGYAGFFALGLNTPTFIFVTAFCFSAVILANVFGRIRAER